MRDPNPSNGSIEKALQGNLCRCTGYEAIMRAARAISTYGKAQNDPLRVEREAITAKLKALDDGSRVEIGTGNKRVIVPANVNDFAALLEAEPAATVVAGSTDVGLWVTKQMRDISPAIFIGNLVGIGEIALKDGQVEIGAGVTYTEAFSTLSKHIPALGPLIDRIGGEQVRNMGTIGGNIANGSPIGDTPPPLIALGATLTVRKGKQRRTIPLEKYFIAYGKQDRQPGEFVEKVTVPVPARGENFAIYKISKRRDEDITATLGAFFLRLASDGTVAEVRIAYGGMAATPKRASAVEAALIGKKWTEETVVAAMAEYATDFSPLTDMRATAEYRSMAARNLLLRFFAETSGAKGPVQVSRHEAA
jgi:xanthine dehydrogenase small subunit